MTTNQSETAMDATKAEAFAERVLTALNNGSLCLMLSIGHRTGLFDTMQGLPPSSAADISAKASLNERYVREWLGAMVTSGVVEVDSTSTLYRLPDEHAASLTRAAHADNMTVFAQYISVLGAVEDDIIACFEKGGGVPYERFDRFHAVMAEDSGQSVLSSLESHVLPLVPGLADRLKAGIVVLDVGCGSGRIINQLAKHFPQSRFEGYDISDEAISRARQEASNRGLQNVEFTLRDVTDLDDSAGVESYDFITTFDAVHDQAQPLNVLKGIHRALKPDGVYLMQDIRASSHVSNNIDHPIGTFLYTISTMHCMTVSLAQGGEGLGAMWGEEKAYEYLKKAGFSHIETRHLKHDIQNNWYVIRK